MTKSIRLLNTILTDRVLNTMHSRYQATFPRILFLCDAVGLFDARPEKVALEIFPLNPLTDATRFVIDVLEFLKNAGIIVLATDPETDLPVGLVVEYSKWVTPGVAKNSFELENRRLRILSQGDYNHAAVQDQEQVLQPIAPETPTEIQTIDAFIESSEPYTDAPTYESISKMLSEKTGFDIRDSIVKKWMQDIDMDDDLDIYVADQVVRSNTFPHYPELGAEERFKELLQEAI